jgi:hypothetical protein
MQHDASGAEIDGSFDFHQGAGKLRQFEDRQPAGAEQPDGIMVYVSIAVGDLVLIGNDGVKPFRDDRVLHFVKKCPRGHARCSSRSRLVTPSNENAGRE